jgi:hypothetical protein
MRWARKRSPAAAAGTGLQNLVEVMRTRGYGEPMIEKGAKLLAEHFRRL